MRPRIVFHIFKKDLTEVLRDRRTVIMAFVVPAVIYPLLFTLLGSVSSDKRGELERARARVAVWGPVPQAARDAVVKDARSDLVDVRPEPPADVTAEAARWVAEKRAQVVLVTPAGATGPSVPVRVLSDSTNVDSATMERRVSHALEATGARLLRERMTTLGQDPTASVPLAVPGAGPARRRPAGGALGAALPPRPPGGAAARAGLDA